MQEACDTDTCASRDVPLLGVLPLCPVFRTKFTLPPSHWYSRNWNSFKWKRRVWDAAVLLCDACVKAHDRACGVGPALRVWVRSVRFWYAQRCQCYLGMVCILCPNLKHHTSGIWHGLMVYIGSVLVYSIYILGCTVSVFGVEYAALLLLVLLLLPLSQEPSHLVTAAGDHQHHQHHLNHQQHLHHQQQRHQHPSP